MLGIYILTVYLYIGIAVGFYNYLTTPKQSHKQIEQDEFKKNCAYWRTQYNCKGGDYND